MQCTSFKSLIFKQVHLKITKNASPLNYNILKSLKNGLI